MPAGEVGLACERFLICHAHMYLLLDGEGAEGYEDKVGPGPERVDCADNVDRDRLRLLGNSVAMTPRSTRSVNNASR
jgi:hypothetical protein